MSALRSTRANANASLTVTVEGSEQVAYDTVASGTRFYRLRQ